MKSVKVFIALMLALYICFFALDLLKSTVFLADRYLFLIRYQTLFLIVSGILIMKLTLQKQSFHFFIVLYAGVWLIYFFVKLYTVAASGDLAYTILQRNSILAGFLVYTQLLTPFPFLVFWFLNRVYLLHFCVEEETENKKLTVTLP